MLKTILIFLVSLLFISSIQAQPDSVYHSQYKGSEIDAAIKKARDSVYTKPQVDALINEIIQTETAGLSKDSVESIIESYGFALQTEVDLKVFEDFTQYISDTPNNDDLFLFMDANSGVVKRVPFSQIMAGEIDLSGYSTNIYTHQSIDSVRNELSSGLSGKANSDHNHSGVYEPANANIQSHISSTSNPHAVTKTQVGLGNVPNTDATNPANITQSSSYRFTTDSEKSTWNNKQDALISGTNIKSINSESILGSGNIVISGSGGTWGSITGTITEQSDLQTALNAKQNTLVSGTNIKTINGTSVIGSGNLVVTGEGTVPPDGWRLSSDHGAVGDGVTDDYNALRDCFASGGYSGDRPDSIFSKLEAGKKFYIGGRGFNWNFLSQSSPMGVRYLHIDGQGSELWTDTTATENGYVFFFTAYYNTLALNWTAIPNSYTRGDLRIKLPYSVWNGAQKGDIIWITTHPDFGGTHAEPDWVRYSVSKGELAEIHKVYSDTTVSFTIPLDESYDEDNTVIKRFFFPTIIIENLSIKAKSKHCTGSNKRAIDFNGIKNSVFRNITVEGFEYLGIMVSNSMSLLFDNIFIRDLSECANYGMNYGIVLGGTQDALITNSNILAGRHAVDLASSYHLPARRLSITKSFLSSDLQLGTASVASHPGVKDFIVTNNIIHGILASRSAHNIFSNNFVLNHFNDGQGTGQAAISIGNAWNPNGGYNIISNNYIEGRFGGIQLSTGNVNGMLGNYYVMNNVVRNQYLLKIDTYYEGDDAVQNVNDIIVHNNDFQPSKTGIWNGSAVIFGYDNIDTLIVNNFSFQNNNIRNSAYGLLIYSPLTRTDIRKLIIKNNNFYSNGLIEVQSGARIGYLDISGNVMQYAGSDAAGGWQRPVWLRSGATITNLKHFGNTYYNFGSMDGEAFVQGASGVVTNWWRGADIVIGTTSYSLYLVSATNGFSLGWTSD